MAYDECGTLEAYKKYAKRATKELLCGYKKVIIDMFTKRINEATSEMAVSQVMTAVREAL